MKSFLHYLVFGVALVSSFGLFAQTEEVVLAIITDINLTLNDDCEALVIPQEVLVGDFDVDGNGVIPLDAFIIVVEDGDESNGPVIDGCGTFNYRVTADPTIITGFTTGWGIINAEDKTAPFFTSTPVAPVGPLYCNDVTNIELGLLPSTVSRCYSVNTADNSIVAGSLNPLLRARLLAGGGLPGATDNCSSTVEICVNDIVTRDEDNPDCEDIILTRSFTVTDGSCGSIGGEPNAEAVTSYEIVFIRPGLDDLNTDNIVDVVTIECGELDANGLVFGDVPAPRPADLPFFDGPNGTSIPLVLGNDGAFCKIGVTFSDSPQIVTCDRAYKVIRTYSIVDWCNPSDVRTFTQIVKIGDFTAPVFTAPAEVVEYNTNVGNDCGAFIRLDLASLRLTDACSAELSLSANVYLNGDLNSAPVGSFAVDLDNATPEVTSMLEAGDHIVRYIYSDDCGNTGFTDVDIRITDGTPPTALCENGLNVSITSSTSPDPDVAPGIAIITPSMIDAGSHDDCSAITLEIGRVRLLDNGSYELLPGASYGPEVVLTCDDLGTVLVGLKVTDAQGLSNFCWLPVLVEDKIAPFCVAPASLNLSCVDFDNAGLPADITDASNDLLDATFGVATGTDNCEVTVTQRISGSVNSCGLGGFTRVFTTTDGAGFTNSNNCVQRVEINGLHDYVITLPGDASAFCMQTPNEVGLQVAENGCDLITVEMSRDTFTGNADECYKVRVEYNIINWCEYNTFGEPYQIPRDFDGDNNLRERTFLYVEPFDAATTLDDKAFLDNDATFGNHNSYAVEIDNGNDFDGLDDQNGVADTEPYATDDSRGAFRYYQFLKIQDEVSPEIVANNPTNCFPATSVNCTGTVSLAFELTDNCTRPDQLTSRVELDVDFDDVQGFARTRFLLDGELTSDANGNFVVTLNNVPLGEHAIRVRGADGCGNVEVEVIEFCVEDGLAPTPICILQTTVTLAPNGDGTGSAAYWATDAIASTVADCSGDVTYSIYKEIETFEDNFLPAPGRDGLIFDCDDDATVPIRVYAFDQSGLSDFCSVLVLVQRADNACTTNNLGNISGLITTSTGAAIDDVDLSLFGGDGSSFIATSDNDGNYEFTDLPAAGDDYTIDPDLESYINHSQGVSTFDLVLITRYILGLDDFESPYQIIAADANGDEEISVQDILAIRRLILGLDLEYRNNSAFRFVDADFVFPVSANPWVTNFPEVLNINNLSGNIRSADFIGIMIGDVSGNDPDNATNAGTVRPRSDVALETAELEMTAGRSYDVTITASEAAGLDGFQGTISLREGVRLLDVTYGELTAGNVNTGLAERGLIPFSFNDENGIAATATLITLRLVAATDVRLSEVLAISDDLLLAEGYFSGNTTVGLGLRFPEVRATGTEPALLQNIPNPVANTTVVQFDLPTAGSASLTVRDVSGRIVLNRTIEAITGRNVLTLHRSDLGASGVMTYTLTTNGFSATRKMVVK